MRVLFPIFLIATLIEIYTIIQVGDAIGGFNTILLIVLTAFLGSFLLKQQGFKTIKNIQNQAMAGNSPAFEMVEGVIIFISGILLLTPGFITDFVGLLGLLPFTRKRLISYFIKKNSQVKFYRHTSHAKKDNNQTIEGEFWNDN